jgi:hypothetical protein
MSFLTTYQIGFAQVSEMPEAQCPLLAYVDPDRRTYLGQDKLPLNRWHAFLIASSRV